MREHLVSAGFVAYKVDGPYHRRIDDVWSAWLGMNRGVYADSVVLNPVVGVRHEGIEELRRSLDSGLRGAQSPPTYSTTLVSLVCSNPRRWELSEEMTVSEYDLVITDIASSLATTGERFFFEHADLEKLATLMRDSEFPGHEYRYPLILNELGRCEDARNYMVGHVNSFPAEFKESMYIRQYEKFHQALSVHMVRYLP